MCFISLRRANQMMSNYYYDILQKILYLSNLFLSLLPPSLPPPPSLSLLSFHLSLFEWIVSVCVWCVNERKRENGLLCQATSRIEFPKCSKRYLHSSQLQKGSYNCHFPSVPPISTILTLLLWFRLRFKPILVTDLVTSKNNAQFKSGQKWLKNNHLASLNL